MRLLWANLVLCTICITSMRGTAQQAAPGVTVDVRMRIEFPQQPIRHSPPAVMWLTPLQHSASARFTPHGPYTLLQKNRTFIPHLLVVPVGTVVLFPNADPFFHNVFSLFDGKRFDLGLYEAGSSKGVTFSREGVSYIFCNIHPEMSAVVLALSTPFNAIADAGGNFQLSAVPPGEYELHLWIEGVPQPELDKLSRTIHLTAKSGNLGALNIAAIPRVPAAHLNEFGQPYSETPKTQY
jgi:plastocyanin